MSVMKCFLKISAVIAICSTCLFAGDAIRGKALFNTCYACHGANGDGNFLFKAPAIAGQDAAYIEAQLVKYKAGIRGAHPKDPEGLQMMPMARTLRDDADVKAVTAYILTLPTPKIKDTLEGGDAAKGKSLYATCMACHGDKGQGNPIMKSPKISSLQDWYLLSQLKKFKTGVRGSNPKDITGQQMRPMAMMLADEQAMKDVIAYIRSLDK